MNTFPEYHFPSNYSGDFADLSVVRLNADDDECPLACACCWCGHASMTEEE